MLSESTNKLDELLGLDLWLDYRSSPGFYENADLRDEVRSFGARDVRVAQGVDTLRQAIVNRIKTYKGELKPLGHPEYGSRHHELIGQPNVERTRNLIKLYILQALKQERRIEKVLSANVLAEHEPPRETVRIELKLQVRRIPLALNIILPLSLTESLT
jgi:phage baseplate assembly protein W